MMDATSSDDGVVLVGRDDELTAILDAADIVATTPTTRDAVSADPVHGRAVVIVGEATTGKTALLAAAASGLTRFRRITASGLGSRRAYGLVERLLRHRFGLRDRDREDDESARRTVRNAVVQVLDDRKIEDVCFFLGQYLDLEFRDSPLTKALGENEGELRALRRAVLRSFLEADARHRPLAILVDDLQAADEDSLEVLDDLRRSVPARVLLLIGSRPDIGLRVPAALDVRSSAEQQVRLGPLASDAAEELARRTIGIAEGELPDRLVDAVTLAGSGNPGLIVQTVQFFREVQVLRDGPFGVDVDLERLDDVRAPTSLEDVSAARLASLRPAHRSILEAGALVGKVFWTGAVLAVLRAEQVQPDLWLAHEQKDLEDLKAGLDELVAAGHLMVLPDPTIEGETEYLFRSQHQRKLLLALIGESRRQDGNRVVAEWLSTAEARFPDGEASDESFLSLLADKLEQGGAHSAAGRAFLRAARSARRAHATRLACDYFGQGLELLGPGAPQLRVDMLHDYGATLLQSGDKAGARDAFQEMLSLAYRFQLRAKGGAAHNRLGRLLRDTGELEPARQHLDAGLRLFQLAGDDRGVAASHDDIGQLLWLQGQHEEALQQMKFGLKMRQQLGDQRSIAVSLDNIALVWLDYGDPGKAHENLVGVLELRRKIGDWPGVARSLAHLGRLAESEGNDPEALRLYHEALEAARKIGERYQVAVLLTNVGVVLSRMQRHEEAVTVLREAQQLGDALGDQLQLAETKRGLAKAYSLQGEAELAAELILEAVELSEATASPAQKAILFRTLAEITATGAFGEEQAGRALDYFTRSARLAKQIGNQVELAKSYRAFATYVRNSPHYAGNERIQAEASKLEAMADTIAERRKQALSRPAPQRG